MTYLYVIYGSSLHVSRLIGEPALLKVVIMSGGGKFTETQVILILIILLNDLFKIFVYYFASS